MASRSIHATFILAAGLSLTCPAAAQQEQWLRYRTAAEPHQFIGGRYSQTQVPTAKPPEGLQLPKFTGDRPLFVRWKSPMAKDSGVWLALDRSGEKRPYNRLYIDSDLDGSLADETAIKPDSSYIGNNRYSATFNLVRVLLPAEDGPVAYHLNVLYRDSRGNKRVSFRPAGWYEGPVTVGGKKLWCTLIDYNGNGLFDDSSMERGQGDLVRIAPKADQSFHNRETDRTTRSVGRHIEIGQNLYELQIAPDGAYVKFIATGRVPTGSVRVGKGVQEVSVRGKQGHFFRQVKDDLVKVPAGDYVVDRWEVNQTDDKGVRWQLIAKSSRDRVSFTVTDGEETKLNIGQPVVCDVLISKSGNGYQINQELKGRLGEQIWLRRNGRRPTAPKVHITNADGSYDRSFRLEYG